MLGRITALWLAACGYGKVEDDPVLTSDLLNWLSVKGILVTFKDINYAEECSVECPCGHGAFGESAQFDNEEALDEAIIDLHERGRGWGGNPCKPCEKLKSIITFG